MIEDVDWRAKYDEYYSFALKDLDDKAAKSILDSAFFTAGAYAKRAAKNDGFYPVPGEYGEPIYSVQQGLRAACHTREEAAAILVIQRTVVRGITVIVLLGLACLALLLYIAAHVR